MRLLAFPDMLGTKAEFCRMVTYAEPNWGTTDLAFQCKSITSVVDPSRNYRGWWILGKNGEVAEVSGGEQRIEYISGAGLHVPEPYGYVESIKNIDGQLSACGYGRQVCRRVNGEWLSMAEDILTCDSGTGFFDIEGAGAAHLYAVGWQGEIYFYDGARWRKEDSPTTAHLACVRCLGPDDVWVCGDKGVVLPGRFNQWQRHDDPGFKDDWYSIEAFNGRIYLAGNDVLACIEDDAIRRVDTGLGKPATVHRLHAKEGLLWAIGRADIRCFDGKTWTEVTHPDNA